MFQQKKKPSAVDIDVYVNSVDRVEQQDELEQIIKKFRETKFTVDTFESTHHAVCRYYLKIGQSKKLLSILNERVKYGIFPDKYIYNMLLDHFIVNSNIEDAVDVVKLMMLQEESGNDITRVLAAYALHQHLLSGKMDVKSMFQELVAAENVVEEQVDEDEIEYIRIPYLTNPFFDDHFDITNKYHLYGKSTYFVGKQIQSSKATSLNENKVISLNLQIIGLLYYQKYDLLQKLLSENGSKLQIADECKSLVLAFAEQETDESRKNLLEKISQQVSSSDVASIGNLEAVIQSRIAQLAEWESADIETMKSLYEQFESIRVKSLHDQMEALLKEKKKQEIEVLKQELAEKTRLYYFFENFSKHQIDFVEAEKRIKEMKTQTLVEENYVPPEV